MQYKPEMEKIQMTENPNTPPAYQAAISNNPQIKRTRQHLIILLSLCLGLALCSAIYHTGTDKNFRIGAVIGQCIIAVIFYGFGIICAYRYSSLGLRIFAWIIAIGLILIAIGIAILLFTSSALVWLMNTEKDASTQQAIGLGAALIFAIAITTVIGSIISIIIVILSFKLARLIDTN